jgi:hypothetical protein
VNDSPTTDSGSEDPFESISSFFESGLWSSITLIVKVFVVALWLALIYWTWQDARRRVEQPAFIAGAVALSLLLPFLGSIIWLIVRPPEYLDDARERELELLALERRLTETGDREGQQIVGRLLGRGVDAEDPGFRKALREAGVAHKRELQELETRLTEVEFRLRLLDRTALPSEEEILPSRTAEPATRVDLDRLDQEASVRARRARPQSGARRVRDDA